MAEPESNKSSKAAEFAAGAQAKNVGLLGELFDFLRDNKKWWLLPIIIVLLLVGLLIILGGSVAAPFIYTLF
jgi:hypothetical protein